MIISYKGIKPNASKAAFVAENAVVAGNVKLEAGSSIWFCAVVRAEEESVSVGEYSNVQDNCVLHVDIDAPLHIGDNVTIGHGAIIHGCTIVNNSLIGMGAIILNHAVIGKNCIIGAGALVTQNTVIPDNSLVIGSPAKVKRTVTDQEIDDITHNAIHYVNEAAAYMSDYNQ